MIKYEYETGMCKQLHYNGLWMTYRKHGMTSLQPPKK